MFTLLAIAVVVLVPHSGIVPIPFLYTVPVLLFTGWFLRNSGETFAAIGVSFNYFELRSVFIGLMAALFLFGFLDYLFFPALERIIALKPANLEDFKSIRHNTGNYVFIVLMGWIVGGFYEEVVFHGFIFSRIEKMLGSKYAMPMGFLITNVIFALYHLQLGAGGVINAFVAGCAYHALMIFFKRNIWYSFFCHGFFDTIALTFIYLGYW